MLSEAVAFFQNNQFASGILASTALGGAAYTCRRIPRDLWHGLIWATSTEIVVRNTDADAFAMVNLWLRTHLTSHSARRFVLTRAYNFDNEDEPTTITPSRRKFDLNTGTGRHMAWYRGRPVTIERSIENGPMYQPLETIVLRFLFRTRGVVASIMEEAVRAVQPPEGIGVHQWVGRNWSAPVFKSRPIESVFLPPGLKDGVIADLQRFGEARDWYRARGLPYRRGYLFSGSPGCGKTSLILALATHFERPVCLLSLASLRDDNDLMNAIAEAPSTAILALEDVDACRVTKARGAGKSHDDMTPAGVTLSGLLNAMDGIGTPDGRVFILTTNHPEHLDAALVRPGRIDHVVRFAPVGDDEQRAMFAHHYGSEALFFPLGEDITPAAMQDVFLRHPSDPVEALHDLRAMTIRKAA